MTDMTSMFQSIKESLSNENKARVSFKEFIKLEAQKTYLGRLVPYIKDPTKTFFHYYAHGWKSLATGQYVDGFCLRTLGERCPICEACFKLYKTKQASDKEMASLCRQQERHLVNYYVIEDPTNANNVGTVKIYRFGKKMYGKILDATEGSDANEFGSRIYDLSENGCNFKIKVEKTSDDFINYDNSRFTSPGPIPNMTPEKLQQVLDSAFDLSSKIEVKSAEDLQAMIDTHLFCVNMDKSAKRVDKTEKTENEKPAPKATKTEEVPAAPAAPKANTAATNDRIKDILKELDA